MSTSMESTKSVTINMADSKLVCSDFVINKEKHAITVSMSLQNIGLHNLLISVNHFCLAAGYEEAYAHHCYINDGQSFELNSGCKSLIKGKSYTLITKFLINPNLPTYQLSYKSLHKHFVITTLK